VTDRRATHRALAQVLDGVAALEHRTLATEPAERETLSRELDARIRDAQAQGDPDLAYRLSLLALRLEDRFLDDVLLSIVRSGRIARLRDLASHVSNLPSSVTRACALALLDLDKGVFRPAAARLGHLDPTSITELRELLILAYTAVHITAQAAMQTAPETAVVFDPIVAALREQAQQAPALVGYELTALALALDMTVHHLLNTSLIPEDRIPALAAMRDSLAAQPGSELLVSSATVMLGILEFAAGRTGRAVASLTSGVAQIPMLHMQASVALIFIRFNAGEWDQADALAARQLGTTLDMLQQPYWHQAFALAALVPACRGESDVVARYLDWQRPDRTVSLADACHRFTESWAHVCQEGVTPELARLVGPLWEQDLIGYIGAFPTVVLLVGSLLAAGHRARAVDARALATRAPYEAVATAYVLAHCDGLLAVHDGRLDDAEAHFTLARQHLDRQVTENPSGGLHLYQALLAEDTAALARRTGRTPGTLLTDLRSAHALLNRCGAVRWAERLNAHVVALGDAPDPEPGPSLLSRLTTREREIALLVAEGLSNREIAERLFVTVRTAEYHVHNALTKTGLRSRVSLREALSSHSP
jgi:DNA-binding CsgD family transcriptional regulator